MVKIFAHHPDCATVQLHTDEVIAAELAELFPSIIVYFN